MLCKVIGKEVLFLVSKRVSHARAGAWAVNQKLNLLWH